MFVISATNDKLWNTAELLKYLVSNQNGNVHLGVNPEAIDLSTLGIYQLLDVFQFNQVDIETHNPLETHDRYNIVNYWKSNRFLKHQWVVDKFYHEWDRRKIFLSFYHRPTAGRLGLAAHLLKNHENKSLIHFSYSTSADDLSFFELDKLLTFGIESMDGISDLLTRLPLWSFGEIENLSKTKQWTLHESLNETETTIHKKIYRSILIDVVVETHVLGKTFFPTEKTVRPMWLKKPFIVFGSKDYLDYLHQMGFRTFCDYWSEEYDGYEGRDRYIKICQLINALADKPFSELEGMYEDMKDILDHNYNLLKHQSYSNNITYIE